MNILETQSLSEKISRLPKWAQRHIETLESRVRLAEATLPWTKPGMEWFTILHPDTRPGYEKSSISRTLFFLGENYAHPVCSVGPMDCIFVGRGRQNTQPPAKGLKDKRS